MKIQYCNESKFPESSEYTNVESRGLSNFYDFSLFDCTVIEIEINNVHLSDYYKKLSHAVERMKTIFDITKKAIELPGNTFILLKLSFNNTEYIKYNGQVIFKGMGIFDEVEVYKTRTHVGERMFDANAHFTDSSNWITKSFKSQKQTTISYGSDNIISLLEFDSFDDIMFFIDVIKKDDDNISLPDWLIEYGFRNDSNIKNEKIKILNKIYELRNRVSEIDITIQENEEHKSVLIDSGKSLESKVRNILGDIFKVDFSEWSDEGTHDFFLGYKDTSIIGEIKGTKTNVVNSYISQLTNHNDIYCEANKVEYDKNIKLGIFNTFKNRRIDDRGLLDKVVVEKAVRDRVIIMTTLQLLHFYSEFLEGKKTATDFIEILNNSKDSGVFSYKLEEVYNGK